MSLLTREQLLAKRDRVIRDVHIPELGGDVKIRALKSAEITGWHASLLDPKNGEPSIKLQKQASERLVAISVVNENGTLLFGKDDLEALNNLENSIVGRIAAAATELNGIDNEDFEELVGNSAGTPADTQPTE